jgi:hypothetical protein
MMIADQDLKFEPVSDCRLLRGCNNKWKELYIRQLLKHHKSFFFSEFFVLQKTVGEALREHRESLTHNIFFYSLPLLA